MKYHEEQQIKLLLVQSVFLKDLKENNYTLHIGILSFDVVRITQYIVECKV